MKQRTITFISADEGKLQFWMDDQMVFASGDVDQLTIVLREMDLSEAMGSSSLDFAAEYGFQNHSGAYELLTQALEMV